MRLVRPYPRDLELVQKISEQFVGSDSAAGKRELHIRHLSSGLLLKPEKQDSLLLIKAVAAHTKKNTKEIRSAALFSPCTF